MFYKIWFFASLALLILAICFPMMTMFMLAVVCDTLGKIL